MSLLERVIAAHHCRSMHHYIALEALCHLIEVNQADWKALFLKHSTTFFEGAKAPDTTFKDFKNHVLHVEDKVDGADAWGGAREAASDWYNNAVAALKARNWNEAIYALGVLSHYFADVCQPFHTGQTEEEGAIHRAVEWSICKSVNVIKALASSEGYPQIIPPQNTDGVAEMVLAAARKSHPFYHIFIDHYDLEKGVADPPAGLDATMSQAVAVCFAHACSGVGALISAAIIEAGVAAPKTDLTLRGYLSTLSIPLHWVLRRLDDVADRATVEAMYRELKETGKVVQNLPDDDRAIRGLHAHQVLKVGLKELDAQALKPLGKKHRSAQSEWPFAKPSSKALAKSEMVASAKTLGEPEAARSASAPAVKYVRPRAEPVQRPTRTEAPAKVVTAQSTSRSRLRWDSPVENAPSIGKKTAMRLTEVGVHTVAQLIQCDIVHVVERLNVSYITQQTLLDWRDQALLKMSMPELRTLDVQILVGAGVRSAEALAQAPAGKLLAAAVSFLKTDAGQRVDRDGISLAPEAVSGWIELAQKKAG